MLLHKSELKTNINALFAAALAFLVSMAFMSCADQLFPEFSVENSYLDSEKAVVVFSAEVNPVSMKKSFLFAEDEKEIEGTIDFHGSKILFFPKETISENHCYKIVVYSGAQDINGNTLQKDYKKCFYTKSDLAAPKIIRIQNIVNGNNETQALEIQFDKKIKQESFANCFSLEPAADAFYNWAPDSKKIAIEFKRPLLEKQLYSVKIEKSLKDEFNNEMENDYYWFWTNNESAKKPNYKIYAKEFGQDARKEIFEEYVNADFSSKIEIEFDKAVLAESVVQGIKIEPQTSFTVEPIYESDQSLCKKAFIIFNERPKWNAEKKMTITDDIKDLSLFSVPRREITIKNNSTLARPPKFECLIISVDEKNIFLTCDNNFQTIEFPIDKYPCGDFTDIPMFFVFSISMGSSKMNELSAYEGINVASYYAGTIDCKAIESLTEEELFKSSIFLEDSEAKQKLDSIKSSDSKLCSLKFSAQFKNAEINENPSPGIIEFLSNTALRDDKNNYLEEETRLSCNKI